MLQVTARKYCFKNAKEIQDAMDSYRANIQMVWDAATEAAEEKFKSNSSDIKQLLCERCGSNAIIHYVNAEKLPYFCESCGAEW